MSKSIAVLVGSLRKESFNLKVAKVLAHIAPSTLQLKIIQIGDLPFYNEDIDNDQPPEAYFGGVASAFDEKGNIAEKSQAFLKQFIDAYAAWVDKVS